MQHSTHLDWHTPQMKWLYKTEPLVECVTGWRDIMARGRLQLLTIVVVLALMDIAILPSSTLAASTSSGQHCC